MLPLVIATAVLLLISLVANPSKTARALLAGARRFLKILPAMAVMLMLVSVLLYVVPEELISSFLGRQAGIAGLLPAALLGSISLIPGFIAFPLCGILLQKGVTFMVLSAFSTSLMMVGILTFPVEQSYLGPRVALVRNALALATALVVALATGFVFGELL